MTEELGLNVWKGQDTSVCKALRLAVRPAQLLSCGARRFSQAVKWFGQEVDLSPSVIAEVKNVWNCTFSPRCVFMMWCLMKGRGNLVGSAQIPGASSPRQQKFALWLLIFVGSDCGTCLMSCFGHLKFWGGS
jgi:hypothetical protein